MAGRGLGVRALARQVPCNHALISRYLNGHQVPSPGMAARLDMLLHAGGELAALATAPPGGVRAVAEDEIAALELTRHATASDVGAATVEQIEQAVDSLAVAYPGTPPTVLLARVRAHLGYVTGLLERRVTFAEHGRLLVAGGWLSLLAATCLIDLHRRPAALAHLRTAAQIARETGHAEIAAWCLETRAWQVLTEGDYPRAVELADAAQRAAPRGGSALIQATAQEGRAWARMGAAPQTRDALARTEALVAPLPIPDRPEHHYRYDPAKSDAYVATTLSWLGDPAAERYARQVLARLESVTGGPPRPRRAASARLDLALALTSTGRPDEAAATAMEAVTSGLLVPSNFWRAGEVITAVDGTGVPGAADLREAYREYCQPSPAALPRGSS
ncbi:MAG TPA: helix-turn-helix domain-containing protein, partial [Streptosporangiaceae bacterium]|nr:helix-turn-helix domain-containing protein [Streptosporangiaceae bacterium]